MLTKNVRRAIVSVLLGCPLSGLVYGIYRTETVPQQGSRVKFFWSILVDVRNRPDLWFWTGLGAVVGIILAVIIAKVFSRVFTGAAFKKHLRGSKLVSDNALARKSTESGRNQITIGGVPMPVKSESLHTLIGGSTGTGKTQIFYEMMYGALRRGDRMIVTDPNAEFLRAFYKPGDLILCPYDARSEGWSIFNEVRNSYDFKNLADSVIPKGLSSDQEEWNGYARLLFAETARKLGFMGRPHIRELYRWCTIAEPDDLKLFLKDTDAESLFVGADKALASARFVLSKYLPEHVNMPEGVFSIRDWLEDKKAGNIFIPWREDMASSLRPLVSAWIDTFCRAVLSMPPDAAQPVWCFLDELDSLEKLESLRPLLTKGRKHGARVVAGLQTSSQVDRIYGREEAITLRACFRNLAALGGARPDPDTPEFFSKALGEHEVLRDDETESNRISTREKHDKERIVLASEIVSLPDLEGFLSFAGNYPVGRINVTPRRFKQQAPAFVDRPPIELHGAEMAGVL